MTAYKENNSWYCLFRFTDWEGNLQQKKKRGFKTKKEALQWEKDYLEQFSVSPHMVLDAMWENYLEVKSIDLRPKTLQLKQKNYRKHIKPYFGNKYVDEIKPLDIKRWHSKLSKVLAQNSIRTIHNEFSAIFTFARKYYGLKENPCSISGNVPKVATEISYWTLEEYHKAIADPRLNDTARIMIEILFWTGLRYGELLALRQEDIHDNYISVSKDLVVIEGRRIVQDSTKNNRVRNVLIHDTLQRDISAYTARLAPGHEEIFDWSNNALQRYLDKLSDIVPRITIHGLRHSHVALLMHLGYPVKAVADRVGDSLETVMNVYAHVYAEDEVSLMVKFDSLH